MRETESNIEWEKQRAARERDRGGQRETERQTEREREAETEIRTIQTQINKHVIKYLCTMYIVHSIIGSYSQYGY